MSTAPTPSSSDDAPAVLVETRPGVVRLTLNRPAKGNALGLTMAREVLAAIAAAEADESVHVLTLTGAGRIFCGGGDVQAMAAAPAGPERRAMIQELGEAAGEVAVALTGSRLLVLAGVNGTAAGAGLGLMLGGDVVLVREDAQLVTAFSALGMTPDTGVSYWLPRVLGPVRATQLLLGGRRLNGTEAVAWGLATEAVAGWRSRRGSRSSARCPRGSSRPVRRGGCLRGTRWSPSSRAPGEVTGVTRRWGDGSCC